MDEDSIARHACATASQLLYWIVKIACLFAASGCGSPLLPQPEDRVYSSLSITIAEQMMLQPELKNEFNRSDGEVGAAPEQKPVGTVLVYITANCRVCDQQKADVVDYRGLEFVYHTDAPAWVDSFPTLHWQTPNGWRQRAGWWGLREFVRTYNASLQPVRVDPARIVRRGSLVYGSVPSRWTWPGDLRAHLVSTHGLSWATVNSWSDRQCAAYHDAAHEGRRGVQRQMRRSACPSGRCPV